MRHHVVVLVSFGVLLFNCTSEAPFPVLQGDYLGQTPPGDTPRLFAPGIVCTGMDDRDIAISPTMDEIFYGVLEPPHYVIVHLVQINGRWQPPQIAPFSGHYNDYEPQFSPDGSRLYFCSERPLSGQGEPKDSDIWFVERTAGGWGDPHNLGGPVNTEKNEFYPSVTHDGTLYFTSHDMHIYRSEFRDGEYLAPEMLPDSVNTRIGEYNAFVAPDESYLIFTSHGWGYRAGRGDLFISYRKKDGSWTQARHLGPDINSSFADMSPTVSPEGKFLFFSSMRVPEAYDPTPISDYQQLLMNFNKPMNKKFDIYWVEAESIVDR